MNPPFYGDWPSIAAFAEQLLAQRLTADPEAVKANKLSQARADDRERVMRAAVAIWRAIVRHEELPTLQATHTEIRLDLASARAAFAKLSAAAPDNTTLARQLALAVALEWNHRGYMPGADLPWILHVHEANMIIRRSRVTREAV